MFFELIHLSDKEYTKQEWEKFLKNLMRRSSTRNKKVQRTAAVKFRPKKLSTIDNQTVHVEPAAGSTYQSPNGYEQQHAASSPAPGPSGQLAINEPTTQS